MVYVIEDDRGRPVKAYSGDDLIYARFYQCHGCGWTVDVDFADYKPNRCPKCKDPHFVEDEYDSLQWEQYMRKEAA